MRGVGQGSRPVIPEVQFMSVATDHVYAGDRPMFATVSPNGDGYRDVVRIRFYVTGSFAAGAVDVSILPASFAATHNGTQIPNLGETRHLSCRKSSYV